MTHLSLIAEIIQLRRELAVARLQLQAQNARDRLLLVLSEDLTLCRPPAELQRGADLTTGGF